MHLDLHVHTKYSFDSTMEPERVVRIARRRGLDGIAVTDHDTIEGALEARKRAPPGFLVIIGEEVSTRGGDIIGLFLNQRVEGGDPAETITRIHAQGGVALLPHPFSKTLGIDEKVAQMLDACEGYNSRHSHGGGTSEAAPFALQYDLTLTGASDAHRYREIGRGRTVVEATTEEEIKRALLSGAVSLQPHPPTPAEKFAYGLYDALHWIVDPIPERQLYHQEACG